MREAEPGVHVVVPHLPEGLRSEVAINAVMKEMTRQLFTDHEINEYVFWYYTPMAINFTDHFTPVASVYDCMDELSAFKGAHSQLPLLEKELFGQVDLVFTADRLCTKQNVTSTRQYMRSRAASMLHISEKHEELWTIQMTRRTFHIRDSASLA